MSENPSLTRGQIAYAKNREYSKAKAQEWAEKNRERSNAIKAAWKKRNKEKNDAINKRWASENVQRCRDNLRNWRKSNNERFRASSNSRRNERRASDPQYLAESRWRVRFSDWLKKTSDKTRVTHLYFGCRPSEFRKWIEDQWLDGMNWENHWHIWQIDHIKPLRDFDLRDIEQVKIAMHYSNTRPLWSLENAKGNCKC